MSLPKLHNIAELCDLFGVTRKTIYDWLRKGILPQPVKRWGSPMWDEADLQELLASRRVKERPAA